MLFFRSLERERVLGVNDDLCLSILSAYIAWEFVIIVQSYNNHRLSTEHFHTTVQLCLMYEQSFKEDPVNAPDNYGECDDESAGYFDDDFVNDGDGQSIVNLEPHTNPFDDVDFEYFVEEVPPMTMLSLRTSFREVAEGTSGHGA